MTTRNFAALIHFIIGRAFDLAQQILGLTDGKKPNDPEHHQPCPIPVEFQSRESLRKNPVTDIQGYGSGITLIFQK